MKRSTVVGYINQAAFNARKALMAASVSKEVSDKETMAIVRLLNHSEQLKDSLKKRRTK